MRLYLDDVRPMPADFHVLAKTAPEAIRIIQEGLVTHISFDHDLGDAPDVGSGYDVAAWIEEKAYFGVVRPMTWDVHSANPPGAARIRAAMESADRWWYLTRCGLSNKE